MPDRGGDTAGLAGHAVFRRVDVDAPTQAVSPAASARPTWPWPGSSWALWRDGDQHPNRAGPKPVSNPATGSSRPRNRHQRRRTHRRGPRARRGRQTVTLTLSDGRTDITPIGPRSPLARVRCARLTGAGHSGGDSVTTRLETCDPAIAPRPSAIPRLRPRPRPRPNKSSIPARTRTGRPRPCGFESGATLQAAALPAHQAPSTSCRADTPISAEGSWPRCVRTSST